MDTIKRLNENLSKLDEARKSALGFLSELTDDKSFVETGAFTSGTTFEDGVEALGEGIITGYATVLAFPFIYLSRILRRCAAVFQARKQPKSKTSWTPPSKTECLSCRLSTARAQGLTRAQKSLKVMRKSFALPQV